MNKLIFLILVFTTLIQAQNNKDITLVLAWKHQFQFAGYYMAKELGFYEKAGLDVTIKEYDLKRDNTLDVSTQKYDFGVGHSSLLLDKLNKYPNIMILSAIYQSSPLILLSLKRDDLSSLKNIAGKKIMMSHDQIYTASINAMLSSEHLKPDSYEILDTSFHPIDLINGNADIMLSYSANEPFTLKEKGIAYTIFDPKDYGYDFYSDILFTSSQMIEKNPNDVKAFYEASMKGWLYAYEHIDESVEIILNKYNTQSRSKKALLFEAKTLKKLAFKDGVRFGEITQTRLNEMINTYRLLGLVHKNSKLNFKSFVYELDSNLTKFTKNKKQSTISLTNIINSKYFKFFIIILFLIVSIVYILKRRSDRIIAIKTKQLNNQHEIFNKYVSSSKTDLDGVITYVSEAFCNETGYTKDELIGKKHNIIRNKITPTSVYKDLWLSISSGHTWSGELLNIKKDGSEYWVDSIISPVFDRNNKIIAYKAIRNDITLEKVLKEFNEKLKKEVELQTKELQTLAQTDQLTKLYNRVKLDKELKYAQDCFLRYEKRYSIILIDIDLFKNVNDTFGHIVGDTILKEVALIIQNSVRATDIVGRWGGEEFLIISPNTNIDGVKKIADKIRLNIQDTEFEDINKITVSAGVAEIDTSLNQLTIIDKADKALYRAKEKGRNRVEQ